MTDLERRIRDELGDQARSAPPPREAESMLRRTRRRQAFTVAGGTLGALVLVIATVMGVTAVMDSGRSEDGVPATPGTLKTTMNGISITHPGTWVVIDPDEAGLNSPTEQTTLPRLVLALAPFEFSDYFGCPALVEERPTFLMTIQEQALALAGEGAAPWPIEPTPLGDLDDTGCYPGWEFLRADWTTAGRSFQARMGLSPDISNGDRQALLAAFESMAFEPASEPATSVVLADGTIGGEGWELIAERQADGLVLSVQGETFGAGGGGLDRTRLTVNGHVFGAGDDAQLLLYGAVPANVVRIGVRVDPDDEALVDVLDVPDAIDPGLNAFVATLSGHPEVAVTAYDANGDVVDTATFANDDHEPVGTPPPTLPDEVLPEHGGTYWGLYLAAAASLDTLELERWVQRMESIGYTPSLGDLACDDGAAVALGIDPGSSRVAIYFDTREDAETAAGTIENSLELGTPVGVARVTTYCLD